MRVRIVDNPRDDLKLRGGVKRRSGRITGGGGDLQGAGLILLTYSDSLYMWSSKCDSTCTEEKTPLKVSESLQIETKSSNEWPLLGAIRMASP